MRGRRGGGGEAAERRGRGLEVTQSDDTITTGERMREDMDVTGLYCLT